MSAFFTKDEIELLRRILKNRTSVLEARWSKFKKGGDEVNPALKEIKWEVEMIEMIKQKI